jgi:hypothetical protein
LYQTLHQHNPEWLYNDIDIYTESSLLSLIGKISQTKNFVLLNDYSESKYNSSSRGSLFDIIIASQKYNIYSKIKENKINIDLKYLLKIDFIETSNNKPEKIISSFDLDCCKIAITIEDNILKFHIHNDFYVDSYSVKNNLKKTISRVKKYRDRGFKCMNLDMYDEN